MNTFIIKTATEEDFFARGRELAKLADQLEAIPEECILSFEDPSDMLKLLSTSRMELLKSIKEQPGTIAALSERLHRGRNTVKRDVAALEKAGIVTIESKVLPGQGRMKEIRAAARKFKFEAELVFCPTRPIE